MKCLYRINIEKRLEVSYEIKSNLEYRFVLATSDKEVRKYIKEVYKEKNVKRVSYCRYKEAIIEL